MEILSSAALLIILMDPFGNMVTLNGLLSEFSEKEKRQILLRESLLALVLLVSCIFAGKQLLSFLHLEEATLKVSGGIVLFVIALALVFPDRVKSPVDESNPSPESLKKESFWGVPIAMPLIAGPSTMSLIFVFANKNSNLEVLSSVMIAWGFSTFVLLISPTLIKWLGRQGSVAIERLAGMLLIMISTQMVLDGVKGYFNF